MDTGFASWRVVVESRASCQSGEDERHVLRLDLRRVVVNFVDKLKDVPWLIRAVQTEKLIRTMR